MSGEKNETLGESKDASSCFGTGNESYASMVVTRAHMPNFLHGEPSCGPSITSWSSPFIFLTISS
jgi:hypothetical protein